MAANPNLFTKTLASMESGDTLLVLGGTFPGRNESAEISLGLKLIVPILHIITGNDRYSPRDNLLVGPDDEDPVTVTLERNDRRFGVDHNEGLPITFGKKAGRILGQVVDIVILNPLSQDSFYFVGKPSED